MVQLTIRTAETEERINYQDVSASRGKAVRAEPVSAFYEHHKVHHVGDFPELEAEMCGWIPASGMKSPNRMDALVWALTDLLVKNGTGMSKTKTINLYHRQTRRETPR